MLGFYVVFLGLKALQKQPTPSVFWLTVGIGVLTLGAISEGVAYQGLGWGLSESHIFEAVVTLVGFGVLVFSLFAKWPRKGTFTKLRLVETTEESPGGPPLP